jgi:adenylylsulfate kinase-like enzyme
MLRKVPKIKDFYEVFLCIDTIVSTCIERGKQSIYKAVFRGRIAEKPLTMFYGTLWS